MSDELTKFFDLLDPDELRGSRPADFIFLCGGYSEQVGRPPPYYSLRHFLLRHPTFQKRLVGYIVLAEDAQNIFDANYYDDLISFEEDIARIASLIAIIAESPGSLAELGSFSSIKLIARRTCAIQQREYETQRSFITLGPIKRLAENYEGSVAYYPWKKNKDKIFHTTCAPHVTSITGYINQRMGLADESFKLSTDKELYLIFLILWIIYLFKEVSVQALYDTVQLIIPEVTEKQIKAKVFALKVAKWVGEEPYESKKYYYCCFDKDPLSYRYKEPGHRIDDYRMDIVASLKAGDKVPRHVVELGRATRRGV